MFHLNQLVGRYQVKKTLGRGGFGTVFLAEDTWLHSQVALKVPHQQTARLDELLAEPRVLAALDHPGILRVFTAEKADDIFFLVMEYVEGESLSDAIDRDGPMKVPGFLDIIGQVLAAVEHAHQRNVVHRDLRPANILVGSDGRAKVADFGISKVLPPSGHAITRIGSPPYMAPEQFSGRTVLQSDIYSIGVIMYEMLTAALPIPEVRPERVLARLKEGRILSARQRNPAVPEAIDAVITQAMAFDVKDRYPAVGDLAAELFARPPSLAGEGLREIRRRLDGQSRPTTRSFCWNCHRPLAKRATRCAHCREMQ